MAEFTIWAFLLNILYFSVTVLVVPVLLRWLDKSLQIDFREHVWSKIHGSPVALSLYFGLRFFGICVLASAFVR